MKSWRGLVVNCSTLWSTVAVMNAHLLAARRGWLLRCSQPTVAARGHRCVTEPDR
jgi:hypothetical protein